jgi:glucose dehydrogenase
MFYDGDEIVQLTNNEEYDGYLDLDGSTVVWRHHDGNDYEIFMAVRIPEPGMIGLAALGGLALLRRRRKG